MKYLLDTNAIIMMHKDRQFQQKLKQHHVQDIAISVITVFELYYGAFNGSSLYLEQNLSRIHQLPFSVLPFTEMDAQYAGKIRQILKKQPIGAYDLLIASQALSQQLILVTHNTREFIRIPELKLEDWQIQ